MNRNFIYITIIIMFFSCGDPEPRRPIRHSINNFHKELIDQNKKLNTREKRYLEHLIAKKHTEKYIPSGTGFWYFFNKKNANETPKPKANDVVTISYTITDIYDNEIYPIKNKTYKVDKEEFISALQDGVKLMKQGEIVTFIIPSYRGYGVTGDGNKIGINQPIKSKVKLISIK